MGIVNQEEFSKKKKKRKKWKIILYVLLGIWLICGTYNVVDKMIIQPALIERENYDPFEVDEEACRELVKVENCLNAFFKDNTYDQLLDEYLYGSFLPDADPLIIRKIKSAAYNLIHYNYYNPNNSEYVTRHDAEKWRDIISTYQKWYKNLRLKLEYYLYSKCKSSILNKNSGLGNYDVIEIKDRILYENAAQEKILQYFDNLYIPSIDYYEMINDDNASYQIWELSKESDSDRECDTKITVFFDHENKRSRMRLFHPQK